MFGFEETKYIDFKRPELQGIWSLIFVNKSADSPPSSALIIDFQLPREVFTFFSGVLVIHRRCLFSLDPALTTRRIVSVSRVLCSSNTVCSWGSPSSLRFGRVRNSHQTSMRGRAYPDLENSMDCVAHGVAQSRTRLSDFHFTHMLLYIK